SGSAAAQTLPAGHGVPWSTSSPSGHAGTPKHLTTSILKQAVSVWPRRRMIIVGRYFFCRKGPHLSLVGFWSMLGASLMFFAAQYEGGYQWATNSLALREWPLKALAPVIPALQRLSKQKSGRAAPI
ncbi:hypothetical protein, partial [Teichococcus aestuarii]|uniref:hypothetical protein n=1 Tax=Teichococcus aestuarii TaxID=568898 RepID=UPI001C632873